MRDTIETESDGPYEINYRVRYLYKMNGHLRYSKVRLYSKGDWCEWPTCDLTNGYRPRNGIRVLPKEVGE